MSEPKGAWGRLCLLWIWARSSTTLMCSDQKARRVFILLVKVARTACQGHGICFFEVSCPTDVMAEVPINPDFWLQGLGDE